MVLYREKQALRQHIYSRKKAGQTIGFVPTMGALHSGHLSLIEQSRKDNSITICSIFVNPTQFNDPNDFLKYPITIETDIAQLAEAGCDILFLPSSVEIYGATPPLPGSEHYDLGYLETVLEGSHRPGHFQGVCMVVRRLLEITDPNRLYLGQKDYQQCMVLTRLVELMGRKDGLSIRICPTLREEDGLAMSSRNMRLNPESRKVAPTIFQTLDYIRQHLAPGDLQALKNAGIIRLEAAGFRVDYLEIADADSLQLVSGWDGSRKLVALVAAFTGEVRLIDNLLLNPGR